MTQQTGEPDDLTTRTEEGPQTATGLRQHQVAIVTPRDRAHERALAALEGNDQNPEALFALSDLIGKARVQSTNKKPTDAQLQMEGKKELLLWALSQFDVVPASFVADHNNGGHRSLVGLSGAKMISWLERKEFKFDVRDEFGYVLDGETRALTDQWEQIGRMVRVAGNYLKTQSA